MAHWAACFCCLLLLFFSILIHFISAFSVFRLALSVAGSTAAAPSRVAECLLCTQNAVFFSCWWLEWISERALGSPPLCVSSVQVKQVCVLHWTFGSSYFTLTGISPSSCALWTYVQHHRVQGLNFLFLLVTFELFFFLAGPAIQRQKYISTVMFRKAASNPGWFWAAQQDNTLLFGLPAAHGLCVAQKRQPKCLTSNSASTESRYPTMSHLYYVLGLYHTVQISLQCRSSQEWEVHPVWVNSIRVPKTHKLPCVILPWSKFSIS